MNNTLRTSTLKALPSAKVLLWSKPVCGVECEVVTEFDEQLERLVDVLTGTMYDHKGIGLAAPQIGVFKRVAVIQLVEERARPPFVMVNPAIVTSAGTHTEWEGCLSLPGNGTRQRVTRPFFVKVIFQDIHGQSQALEEKGLMARAIQHEVDHLHGRFFIDQVSKLKRDIVLRNYAKAQYHDMGKYRHDFSVPGEYENAIKPVPAKPLVRDDMADFLGLGG